jgi:hypothetical protein
MKFKDIVAGRFSIFNRMNETKRNEQIDAVKYALMIASTSGIDIQEWDCQEVFGFGKSPNEIIISRTEINKRLFEKEESLRETRTTSSTNTELTDIVKNAINVLSARAIADQIAVAEERARSYIRQSMDYYRNFESYIKNAASSRASIAHLKGQDFSIVQQVETIDSGDFWHFEEVRDDGSLIFITKHDVICTLKNPAAGIDITVNFGKFQANFNISNTSLIVDPYDNNLNVDGYYHPHINSGRVCWGNASDAVAKAISNLDVVQAMLLLSSVLIAYTPGTPYVSIEEFYRRSLTEEERKAEEERRKYALAIARGEIQPEGDRSEA